MLLFIGALACLTVTFLAILLKKTYGYLPARELQRQAASADQLSSTFWRAVAYGESLQVLLWLVVGLSAAGSFMLLDAVAPSALGFVAVVLVVWLAFVWLPNTRLTPFGAKLAAFCTPAVVWLLRKLNAPLTKLAELLRRRYPADRHTGVYEREDLEELLARQKDQTDSRIAKTHVEVLERALKFDDRLVRDIVVPRKKVSAVNVEDNIGPVLLDELHASKHTQFPVYEGKPTNIIGTVLLRDLAAARAGGKVASHVNRAIFYTHEADDLATALEAFHASKASLLVVVNGFEEYVGIVTLNDVLQELLGPVKRSDFALYDDRAAVAAKHSQTHQQPEAAEPEQAPLQTPVAETSTEV